VGITRRHPGRGVLTALAAAGLVVLVVYLASRGTDASAAQALPLLGEARLVASAEGGSQLQARSRSDTAILPSSVLPGCRGLG
jgi:hypothetical protein